GRDLHDTPVSMLAKQHNTVVGVDHGVRPDEGSSWSVFAVVASRPQNLSHATIGRPLPHNIARYIAKPQISGLKPQRPLDELESSCQFFNLRRSRHYLVQRRIEPKNAVACCLRHLFLSCSFTSAHNQKCRERRDPSRRYQGTTIHTISQGFVL